SAPAGRAGDRRHARAAGLRRLRRRHRRARSGTPCREPGSHRRRRRVRRRLPRRPERGRRTDCGSAPRLGPRRRPALREGLMIAHVQTADGLAVVDLDEEAVLELDPSGAIETTTAPTPPLPRVVAAAETGATIVALVGTKP